MLLFSFFLNIFLCQGYELSGEIALKNNHYYYSYYIYIGQLPVRQGGACAWKIKSLFEKNIKEITTLTFLNSLI